MHGAAAEMGMLGVHGVGFKSCRSILAWKTFVRYCLEYGLAVIQPNSVQMRRLEKAHDHGLRKAIGGYTKSSREAMRQLAQAEPIQVRVLELQVRWILRTLKTDSGSILYKCLPDMVNDTSSPFRKLTDHNILYSKLRVPGMRLGSELRSLWTEQEIAATIFMNNRGSKCQFCEGNRMDSTMDYFSAAQELNVTEKFLQDQRR